MAYKGIKNKPRKQRTMNEMMDKGSGISSGISDIITIDPKLVDANGLPMGPSDIKEDPIVKGVLEYNRSIFTIENEYSDNELMFTDGTILVRLFRKIPVSGGLYRDFSVPVSGSKQLKPEFARDPYFFNNIGVIINYDKTYENDPERWRFTTGDLVMVDPRMAMTTVLKLKGIPPYLESGFMSYNEERSFDKLGYIKITKREIICRLPKFKIEDYENSYLGK